MRHLTFLFVLSLGVFANAQEPRPYLIASLKGHATYLDEYFAAVLQAQTKPFDEQMALKQAADANPIQKVPGRMEFETKSDYEGRVDPIVAANSRAAAARDRARQAIKAAKEQDLKNAEQAKNKVSQVADRTFDELAFAFPISAPRFDIDTRSFGPPELPAPILGDADYGLAALRINLKPEGFRCDDVSIAKRIREVSDGGNLWAIVHLSKARVTINPGRETVRKSEAELKSEQTKHAAAHIGARLLAEYFKPGSTQNVPYGTYVEPTKQVSSISIGVAYQSWRYAGIYDAGEKKEILTFPR